MIVVLQLTPNDLVKITKKYSRKEKRTIRSCTPILKRGWCKLKGV